MRFLLIKRRLFRSLTASNRSLTVAALIGSRLWYANVYKSGTATFRAATVRERTNAAESGQNAKNLKIFKELKP